MIVRLRPGLAAILLVGVVVIALVTGLRAFGAEGFYLSEREWQTAITSWWMAESGHGVLSAETPIMGPPWRIPFEAPLFQWLTAQLTTNLCSLEDTGRLLSLVLFMLNVLVIHRLVLSLELPRRMADTTALLMLSSPLFAAYSFSFTIESSANLAATLWLWGVIRWLRHPSAWLLAASLAVGTLAVLIKSTTWAVYAVVAGLLTARHLGSLLSFPRLRRLPWRDTSASCALIGVPLMAGLLWTTASDAVKRLNPLTAELTSSAVSEWTLGTVDQRLDIGSWFGILATVGVLVLGPAISAALLWRGMLWFRRPSHSFPTALVTTLCVGAAAGPLVFMNLYVQHDYYAMAGGVFVLILAAIGLGSQPARRVLVMAVLSNLLVTTGYVLAKQANYEDPLSDGLAHAVSGLPPNRSLIVYGAYMDSRLPYLAEQKAVQTRATSPNNRAVSEVLARIPADDIGAVLTRSGKYVDAARETARRYELFQSAELAPGVFIFFSRENRRFLDLTPIDLAGEYRRRVAGFDPDLPKCCGLLLPAGPDSAPGFGLSRGGNLYLFDVKRGLRVVHRRWAPTHR